MMRSSWLMNAEIEGRFRENCGPHGSHELIAVPISHNIASAFLTSAVHRLLDRCQHKIKHGASPGLDLDRRGDARHQGTQLAVDRDLHAGGDESRWKPLALAVFVDGVLADLIKPCLQRS